ncbi:PREDICTED: poly(A) RNA polymerase gld-2 homolog A-like isoform X2 [Ceratosolen solmsi marchali]|nr:PREDICTED: poly(A) RNA polymerase gld-2 homolog A-like isoform X2 [Ceratosolen solmsi marchali]
MVQVVGSYQANGQFLSLQNHAFYTSSPTNMHQEFIQFGRNTSNNNRQRATQQGSYPFEILHRFNMEAQNANYALHTGGTTTNWPQRMNSPNSAPTTPQRMNTSNPLSITPVQPRINYRPMTTGSTKKHVWSNNNKLDKRHSYQDLPLLQESCNNSDSGFSSRSPTPNKYYKSSSQTESSDERDSLPSVSELQYKNRNTRQNHSNRGSLVTSLSTSNLYQDDRLSNDFNEMVPRSVVQNHQNRRKYPTARITPTIQRPQRGKKFTGAILSEVNVCPKYYYSPADRFLDRSHLIQTKQRPSKLLTGSVYDKLSKAIWEKFEQNQLTQSTFCHKMYLWKYLFFYIKSRFPQYGLFMVGSTLNGFGSNVSDVDMCLLVRDTAVDQRSEAIYRLGQIMSCLKRSDFISHLELIQAKVPILKIRDNVYNLDVDLNYNNVVGIRNTHLLHCYSRIDWRVRPLVLVVKMWAQCQNINDARHMTISSYSLVLMVIHFLQCGVTPAVLPCLHNLFKGKFHPLSDIHSIDIHEELNIPNNALHPRNTQTLGELLIEFFRYYDSFDYDLYAISVRVAGKIPIETCRYVRSFKNDPHQWKYLCIEEPFDFTNTARSVYDLAIFQMIKEIFKQTHQRLKKSNNLNSIFTRLENNL